jgi:hypothetical protein
VNAIGQERPADKLADASAVRTDDSTGRVLLARKRYLSVIVSRADASKNIANVSRTAASVVAAVGASTAKT